MPLATKWIRSTIIDEFSKREGAEVWGWADGSDGGLGATSNSGALIIPGAKAIYVMGSAASQFLIVNPMDHSDAFLQPDEVGLVKVGSASAAGFWIDPPPVVGVRNTSGGTGDFYVIAIYNIVRPRGRK